MDFTPRGLNFLVASKGTVVCKQSTSLDIAIFPFVSGLKLSLAEWLFRRYSLSSDAQLWLWVMRP